jgi:hypothetical protein
MNIKLKDQEFKIDANRVKPRIGKSYQLSNETLNKKGFFLFLFSFFIFGLVWFYKQIQTYTQNNYIELNN